mmetsp:Transcript_55049/g.128790  ORF Transcript_55049/g.128790 Transcript_55049/m.128790 type:complete len:303 (-) Transcript_55049:219-1127(-)
MGSTLSVPDGEENADSFLKASLGDECNLSTVSTDELASEVDQVSNLSSADSVVAPGDELGETPQLEDEVVADASVTLNLLAELKQLQADEWDRNCMLVAYLRDVLEATDIVVGPQTEFGCRDFCSPSTGVFWRASRTVECRVPVPPAPLCPRSTRMSVCFTIYAVHLETGTALIVESISRTHDVPFGSSFFVRELVSLQPSSGDADHAAETRMVKTSAIEFTEYVPFRSIIEQKSLAGQRAKAKDFVEMLQRRSTMLEAADKDQVASNIDKRKRAFRMSLQLVTHALARQPRVARHNAEIGQ